MEGTGRLAVNSSRFALLVGVLLTKDWSFSKNTSNLETPKSYKFQMSFLESI